MMERRELFRSLTSSFIGNSEPKVKESIIRPPYGAGEESFSTLCIGCADKHCVTACEEEIIFLRTDGTVELDLTTSNGCTFCDECAIACEPNVLSLDNKQHIDALIEIDILKCLSWHQTMCFSCKDPCLDNAIDFLGMFRPTINQDKCTSCGFCTSRCPAEAITIKGKK